MPAVGTAAKWKLVCQTGSQVGFCPGAPPSVSGSSVAFDNATADRYFLVFGGVGSGGSTQNETSEWLVNQTWHTVGINGQTAAVGPTKASNASMTYDGTDGYVLLFGGWSGSAGLNQTYSFHAGAWTKRTAAPSTLTGRGGECLVWVPPIGGKGNYTLLFGGGSKTQLFSSTWTYAGGTWTNRTSTVTGGPPSARTNSMCAWDPATSTVDLFGGWTGAHTVANDLWRFDPTGGTVGSWTNTIANNTIGSPPARQLGAMFYDSLNAYMVLSSGANGSRLKIPGPFAGGFDTWSLTGSTWANITVGATKPSNWATGLEQSPAAWSQPYQYAFRFGGSALAGGQGTTQIVGEMRVGVSTTLSVAPFSPQLNSPLWLNSTTTGGNSIYIRNWTGLPGGCTATNTSQITCSPTVGGIYNVTLNVTDTGGNPLPFNSALNVTLTLPSPPPATVVGGNLTVGGQVGVHLNGPFFGTVQSPPAPNSYNGGSYPVGTFLNSSPISIFRIGGGETGYDPTTNIKWVPNANGNGTFTPTGNVTFNLTAFKPWCLGHNPTCQWLYYLPGEVNSTSFAVHTAQWFHTVYGLAPTYWELGNEPGASSWSHYGKNYSAWLTTDAIGVTPEGYATMVKNYITAVHALYPSDKFIGIEAACACNSAILNPLIAQDWTQFQALSYHSYPTAGLTNPYGAIGAYYATLSSTKNVPGTMAQMRGYLTANCGGNLTCLSMPIQIGEYNGGPASNFSVYDHIYQNAVWIAASVTQGLTANVSSFQYFSLSLLKGVTNTFAPSFAGLLYQRILANMTMGVDYATNITGPSVGGGAYAISTVNGSSRSVLLVNTNLSHSITVAVGSGFPVNGSGRTYVWSPALAFPQESSYASIPTVLTVPSQGILLVDNFGGASNNSTSPLGGAGIITVAFSLVILVGILGVVLILATAGSRFYERRW